MAYEPHEWVAGETRVSAELMNHIEQGVADAHDAAQKASQRPSGFTVTKKAWDELLARVDALDGA